MIKKVRNLIVIAIAISTISGCSVKTTELKKSWCASIENKSIEIYL